MTAPLLAERVAALLRRSWHPVCSLAELQATDGGRGPLSVRLCGEELVVADLGDGPVVLRDRCLHRSTRLSIGWVDGDALQCAYHGWRWDGGGRCVGIPSLPDARPGAGLPSRRIAAYSAEVRYGLVWCRLEDGWPTEIPACPAYDDHQVRTVAGEPYTWPVSVHRRVENFTDLAHFAWVHDGSLGDRRVPEVPIPEIHHEDGALRFGYLPPVLPTGNPAALLGSSDYTVTPTSVNIDFVVPGIGRRVLWMATAPIDDSTCRTYWFTCRADDLDGDDAPHLEFQDLVLAEDEPVVARQHPGAIPWQGEDREVSVRTDAVSLAYRHYVLDLAAAQTPAELAALLTGRRSATAAIGA